MKKISSQIIHIVVVATILFVAFSTITFAVGMTSGTMFSCPLMMTEHPVVCPMTAVDHVAGWKLLSAAVREYSSVIMLLAIIISFYWLNFRRIIANSSPSPQQYRSSNNTYQLHHYLLDAFSEGILHSKLYT